MKINADGQDMTETEIKTIIQRELPNLIADDPLPLIRDFITMREYCLKFLLFFCKFPLSDRR
jgi:hypothetical protein